MSEFLTFATVEVGRHFGSHVWQASAEVARRWRESFSSSGEAAVGETWPAALAFVYTSQAVLALMPPKAEGGIHAKQAFSFAARIGVGDTLTTELYVREKYIKRERKYVEMGTRTHNQRGELVLEGVRITIWAE